MIIGLNNQILPFLGLLFNIFKQKNVVISCFQPCIILNVRLILVVLVRELKEGILLAEGVPFIL